MPGYLDQYGAGEERRNRIILRGIVGILTIAIVWVLGWYLFLNHHQEAIGSSFLDALRRGDNQAAYRIWGCTSARPCSGYEFPKFLRDWGPGPNGPDLALLALTDSEECNSAVMLTVRVNKERTESLWIQRNDDSIGFAPYTSCPQQIPYAIMVHRTLGKVRNLLLK